MRKRRREQRLRFLGAVLGAALSVLAVAGWYGIRSYQNREMAKALNTISAAPEETAAADPDQIVYEGKTYRRNRYVKAILCMGIDRGGTMTESKEVGKTGQADGIFLLAQDTVHNSLRILMIPRDTMTEVERIHEDGTYRASGITHLNVAFAYGDGRETSCQNMSRAVSRLLGGLPIDSYMAVDVSIIPALNDAVGGVTVTIPYAGMEKADPSFTFGSKVLLKGETAERFVRFRDTDQHQSAMMRMTQHKEYISQYFEAVKDASRSDSGIVSSLFDMAQDYMVTDMAKGEYLKVAADALTGEGIRSEDFYMLPGTGVSTEVFDEYYADNNALTPMLLELFYRQAQ